MPHTRKDIFFKCWLWSVVGGLIVAAIFYTLADLTNAFHHIAHGGTIFIDLLMGLGIVGSYASAGYIGWRIVDKYYHGTVTIFLKRYKIYSAISLLLLVGLIYSPFSPLGFLWSVLAPCCVLLSLSTSKKAAT